MKFQVITNACNRGWGQFSTVAAADKWNAEGINWLTLKSALEIAEDSDKKIMLVIHSEGCGACDEYSRFFSDPDVTEASKDLLMVLIDDGEDEKLSEKYSIDGSYVPRTYFLDADGKVVDIRVGKEGDRFQYYFGGRKAQELVQIMMSAS